MVKLRYRIITFVLAVITLFTVFTIIPSVVKADSDIVEYTNVLDDLKKDESFKINQYPSIEKENTLQVIQIAESVNNELFIYVYAPSSRYKRLIANEIRMGLPQFGIDTSYKDYKLILLNTNGVFQKYKVAGLTIEKSNTRYYDIVQLARPIDYTIDKEFDIDQTASNVPCAVSQKWEVTTIEGKTTYRVLTLETITITDKFVGFIRYWDGFKWIQYYTDSHFVAFSTDRNIENLLEVDITYKINNYEQTVVYGSYGERKFEGEQEIPLLTLKQDEKGENSDIGLFGDKYIWNRIQSTDLFLDETKNQEVEFLENSKTEIQKTQWVLRFLETKFTDRYMQNVSVINGTMVTELTILRLKFETDGKTYNLGVIDNKQTGSEDPVGTVGPNIGRQIADLFKKLIALVLILLLGFGVVYLLIAFGPLLISLFGKIFTMIFKVIIGILAFPFKLLGKLFKKKDKG